MKCYFPVINFVLLIFQQRTQKFNEDRKLHFIFIHMVTNLHFYLERGGLKQFKLHFILIHMVTKFTFLFHFWKEATLNNLEDSSDYKRKAIQVINAQAFQKKAQKLSQKVCINSCETETQASIHRNFAGSFLRSGGPLQPDLPNVSKKIF